MPDNASITIVLAGIGIFLSGGIGGFYAAMSTFRRQIDGRLSTMDDCIKEKFSELNKKLDERHDAYNARMTGIEIRCAAKHGEDNS